MASEKQKWNKLFHSPALMIWLVVWIIASYALWRQWKNGTPWPLGSAMPF